jgi:hypothetical protein
MFPLARRRVPVDRHPDPQSPDERRLRSRYHRDCPSGRTPARRGEITTRVLVFQQRRAAVNSPSFRMPDFYLPRRYRSENVSSLGECCATPRSDWTQECRVADQGPDASLPAGRGRGVRERVCSKPASGDAGIQYFARLTRWPVRPGGSRPEGVAWCGGTRHGRGDGV